MADHELRTGMRAPASGRYTPSNGGSAVYLSEGERFPPAKGESTTFTAFDPDRYIGWLTELQASAALSIAAGVLSMAIDAGEGWTGELRYLHTRYGRLYDPSTIDAAAAARGSRR